MIIHFASCCSLFSVSGFSKTLPPAGWRANRSSLQSWGVFVWRCGGESELLWWSDDKNYTRKNIKFTLDFSFRFSFFFFRLALIKKYPDCWKELRQDPPPLEAILVIFGRRALIFFCLKALEKKKEKRHHFCAHAQWWSPWRRKNVENGHLAPSNLTFFIICDRHKRFSQNERRRIDLQNIASDFLIFAWGLSYDLSKFSDDFTPFFRLWKTITKALDKN